jgi:hypothetical protein
MAPGQAPGVGEEFEMYRALALVVIGALLAPTGPALAQDDEELAEIARKLDNPLSDLWMIFLENQMQRYRGFPADGSQWVNSTVVQPVMPVSLTENWNLITRPIVPILTAPKFRAPGIDYEDCPGNCNSDDPRDLFGGSLDTSRNLELGDIVLWSMISPADPPELPDGGKLVWGLGPTFQLPTASEDQFGSNRWSFGPSAILLRLPPPPSDSPPSFLDKITAGVFAQYHLSAGPGSGGRVSRTQIQPIYWYKLPWGQWQVGGFPMININHEAKSDNRYTVPIELNLANTIRVGPMPVRIGLGAGYAVESPDDYGLRWYLKFFIIPVIPKPIQRTLF